MKKCKICGKNFTDLSIKVHVKKQHGLTYREYRLKFNEIEYQKCLYCGTILKNLHSNAKYCNNVCNKKYKKEEELRLNNEKYKDIDDIPTCVICGIKGLNLISHINNKHKITTNDYMNKYNLSKNDIYHKSYIDKIGVSGEKNGAYNHGGKYSPFSKKFIYYTEEKRQSVIKKASNNRKYNTRREYFLEDAQINHNLADWLFKQRQATFSKEICIEKYGEEKGLKIWKARQDKWQNTLNSKDVEELKRINKAKMKFNGFSKKSQKLFWKLYELIKNDFNNIYFAQLDENKKLDKNGKNHEYIIITKEKKCYFFDFFIKDIGKIIEFDGDYWHGKKRGNQKRDKERDVSILNEGYDIIHIKERDWNFDNENTIKKCLEFIYGTV